MAVPRNADEALERLQELPDYLGEHRVVGTLAWVSIAALFGAAFPRLAHRLRWRSRLTPRGHLAWIAVHIAIGIAAGSPAVRRFHRRVEAYHRSVREFVRRHGRNPTDEEARGLWSETAAAADPR